MVTHSDPSATALLTEIYPKRQKKTTLACLPCQKAHYSCNDERPCQSCIKRGKPNLCVDGMKKKAKYLDVLEDVNLPPKSDALKAIPEGEEACRLLLLAQTAYPELTKPSFSSSSSSSPSSFYPTTQMQVFDYSGSTLRVLEYLRKRLGNESMRRVCSAMAAFRSGRVAINRTLAIEDIYLQERCFTRTILELSRILPIMGASHCLWRRTGDIAYASREFSMLTGWSQKSLASGQHTIFELLDERGIVSYWEEYAKCIFERTLQFFRLGGSLKRADGKAVNGTFWITIRRDIFDIPLVMVGSFLPNLWQTNLPGVTTTC